MLGTTVLAKSCTGIHCTICLRYAAKWSMMSGGSTVTRLSKAYGSTMTISNTMSIQELPSSG